MRFPEEPDGFPVGGEISVFLRVPSFHRAGHR